MLENLLDEKTIFPRNSSIRDESPEFRIYKIKPTKIPIQNAPSVSGRGRAGVLHKGEAMVRTKSFQRQATSNFNLAAQLEHLREAREVVYRSVFQLLRGILQLASEILAIELRTIREELGLSKRALALIAGVPAMTITTWERELNRHEPRLSALRSMCESLSAYALETHKAAPTLQRLNLLVDQLTPLLDDLQLLRSSLGLSREQLAHTVKTSPSRVRDWETGRSEPRVRSIRILCEELLRAAEIREG